MRTRPVARAATRGLGLAMVWAGGTLLLYVVWLLWFTGIGTAEAQQQLLAEFPGTAVDPAEGAADGGDDDRPAAPTRTEEPVEIGDGVAVLAFERPGAAEPLVLDGPVVVVSGTTTAALRTGPGHYTTSAAPGEQGNFAVAGHRTTYGAPFHDLDEVAPGDLVHVTTRDGTRHTYAVLPGSSGGAPPGQHVVAPSDTWVLAPDAVAADGPLLTLTTCHPRYSATQRLVVFAELVASAVA